MVNVQFARGPLMHRGITEIFALEGFTKDNIREQKMCKIIKENLFSRAKNSA